ncbi:hypothetical protein H0H93_003077 [Arthromyces matolae]|nr:hypothetical protein H0H93_003077 [Arthromyces matolae]
MIWSSKSQPGRLANGQIPSVQPPLTIFAMKALHVIAPVISTIMSLTLRAQALPSFHLVTRDVSTDISTVHHHHSSLVSRLAESLLVDRALTNPRERLDDMKTKAQGFLRQHKVSDLLRELSEMEKDFGRKTSTPKNLDAGTMLMGNKMATIKRRDTFGLMFDYDWRIFDKHPGSLPMTLKPIIPDEYSGQTLLALGEEYLTKSTDQSDVVIRWQLRLLTGIMMVQNGHNELFFGLLAQLPATYKQSTKPFVKDQLELVYQFYCMIAVTHQLPVPFSEQHGLGDPWRVAGVGKAGTGTGRDSHTRDL